MKRTALATVILAATCGFSQAQQAQLPVGLNFPGGKTVDVAGFYLGMTAAQARPLLEKHYASQSTKAHYHSLRMPFTNEEFVRSTGVTIIPTNTNLDIVSMMFSGPPSGNQALFIRRSVDYQGNARPSREATIAAIKQKFGEPSREEPMRFDYYFKGGEIQKGHPASECATADYQLGSVIGSSPYPDEKYNILKQAFNTVRANKATCDLYISVRLSRSYDTLGGQRSENTNVISGIVISMVDFARLVATNNVDAQAIAAQREKAKQSLPTGAPAPKL